MKRIALIVTLLASAASVASAAYDPQHKAFTKLLAAHVRDGVVSYAGLKKESASLDAYLADIAAVDQAAFDKLARNDQMAYLVNAYNAFTLRLITDFYPVESIRDIGPKVGGGIFGGSSKQWKIPGYEVNGRKVAFRAMGRELTLDEIEHKELRPKYQDARVHFALVCGAVSCPFLRSEAYVGARLGEQLDAQGRQFLADPFRNYLDEKQSTLYLSKIFDWFSDDFQRDGGSVYKFVSRFLPARKTAAAEEEPKLKYLNYDWSLNDKAGKRI